MLPHDFRKIGFLWFTAQVTAYLMRPNRQMREALAQAGATAPPWFQAPEVSNYSDAQLGQALCDAAHRAGSVQPIDF